jgi:hypothetical protein
MSVLKFLPINELQLDQWMILLSAGYLLLVFAVGWLNGKRTFTERFLLTKVFDSNLFSGSLMLMAGLMNPPTFAAISDNKPFLSIAGFSGIVYSLTSLWLTGKPEDVPVQGAYRITKPGGGDYVLVTDGTVGQEIPAWLYRTRGYKPSIHTLPVGPPSGGAGANQPNAPPVPQP